MEASRGWSLALWYLVAGGAMFFWASIWPDLNAWAKMHEHIGSWLQGIGGFLAIAFTVLMVNWQVREQQKLVADQIRANQLDMDRQIQAQKREADEARRREDVRHLVLVNAVARYAALDLDLIADAKEKIWIDVADRRSAHAMEWIKEARLVSIPEPGLADRLFTTRIRLDWFLKQVEVAAVSDDPLDWRRHLNKVSKEVSQECLVVAAEAESLARDLMTADERDRHEATLKKWFDRVERGES